MQNNSKDHLENLSAIQHQNHSDPENETNNIYDQIGTVKDQMKY
jgi:hypothetical protein